GAPARRSLFFFAGSLRLAGQPLLSAWVRSSRFTGGKMRKLFLSTLAWLFLAAPVMAQSAPVPAVSPVPPDLLATPPSSEQHRPDLPSLEAIENELRARLGRAGFSDIEMIPTSFLVRAKDAAGNSVVLVISPDSVAELKQNDTTNGAAPRD